jgi:hypothetical protein
VKFIATLQQRGAVLESQVYPPYAHCLRRREAYAELEFFVRHYLIDCRGIVLEESTRHALRENGRR